MNELKFKLLLSQLNKIQYGSINIIYADKAYFYTGQFKGPSIELSIYDLTALSDIFNKGDIGLAEAYRDNKINISSISDFILFACLNEQVIKERFKGSFLGLIFYKIKHLLNKNTESGSKKNISAHYDLGNNFYNLWLDKTMTYSSGIVKKEDESLEEIQINKYDAIIDKLNLKPSDHILEIGCGWGGFFTQAVKRTGCKVTAVTISQEQYDYCKLLISQNKLKDHVTLLFLDYRKIEGKFNHIVSIEMIEAVGYEYWLEYFSKIDNLLEKSGKVVIQGISIKDDLFNNYINGTDFIQQYIFPGGNLISDQEINNVLNKTNLSLKSIDNFGLSYAETLHKWHVNFDNNLSKIKNMGFDDKFIKIWKFYLGYCQGAFLAERINVGHYLLQKK